MDSGNSETPERIATDRRSEPSRVLESGPATARDTFQSEQNYNPGPPVRSRGSVLQVPTCSVTSCMTSLTGEK